MTKVVCYRDGQGNIYSDPDGVWTLGTQDSLNPAKTISGSSSEVVELVKQGLTADDLVKLKNLEII